MRKLFVDQGRWCRFVRKLSFIIEIWWVKYFFIPIFETIPPALLLFAIDHNSAANATEAVEKAKVVGEATASTEQYFTSTLELIAEHPFETAALVALYLILFNGVISAIRSKGVDEEEIDSIGLLKLFEVLEEIVGVKSRRFGGHLKDLEESSENDSHDGGVTFDTITKPKQQIAVIAKGLHAFFDAIDKEGVAFRVSVIEIEDNKPMGYFWWCPDSSPPTTAIDALQSPESSISACISSRNIIIIPDVQAEADRGENRHYVPADGAGDEEGSLVCYPIIHQYTDTIPYAITIVADKRNYFTTERKKLYKWVFKHFAVRMSLEHSLLVLKKGVINGED